MKILIFILNTIAQAQQPLPYSVDINVVIQPNSHWTESSVKAQVDEASKVFEQCGVKFRQINTTVAGSSGDPILKKDIVSTDAQSLRGFSAAWSPTSKPTLFFVEGFSLTGFPPEESTAFSKANFKDASAPALPAELADTVWMPVSVLNPGYHANCKNAKYSTLAHEMAHVLTLEGSHNNETEANLLSLCMQGRRNNHLTKKQCDEIIANPLVLHSN